MVSRVCVIDMKENHICSYAHQNSLQGLPDGLETVTKAVNVLFNKMISITSLTMASAYGMQALLLDLLNDQIFEGEN